MKFKEWLYQEFESGVFVKGNGNTQDFPGANLNTGMPVASKISTKDGSDKEPPDSMDGKTPPDTVFGFRSPSDKKATNKRRSQWLNTNSRRAPITTIPPDIIY